MTELGFVIISNSNNKKKIEKSINSIKTFTSLPMSIYVALKENEEARIGEAKSFNYTDFFSIIKKAREIVDTKYIAFINEGDTYCGQLDGHLTNKVAILPIDRDGYALNNLINNENAVFSNIWTHLNSMFIEKALLDQTPYKSTGDAFFDGACFATAIIEKNREFCFLEKASLKTTIPIEFTTDLKPELNDPNTYFNRICNLREYINNGEKIKLRLALYIIKNLFWENSGTRNKQKLDEKAYSDFIKEVATILNLIDERDIAGSELGRDLGLFLLSLRNDSSYYPQDVDGEICIKINEDLKLAIDEYDANIWLMNNEEGQLIIAGRYALPIESEEVKLVAKAGDKYYYAGDISINAYRRYFGVIAYRTTAFEFAIPLNNNAYGQKIAFYLKSEKTEKKLEIKFTKPFSRLFYQTSYWVIGKFIVQSRNNEILLRKNTAIRRFLCQLKDFVGLRRFEGKEKWQALFLKLAYIISKPWYRKETWLFQDKIYKAGDNGEYLYTYSLGKNDGIKKYYILDKNCKDAERFKKEGKPFVNYGSLKHELLFLNSNIVFSTHKNPMNQHGFPKNLQKLFRGTFKFHNVCIQHGLSVQYIPGLVNRIEGCFEGFFCASNIEKENLLSPGYAYENHEDVIKLTGCPRYDGLINKDKKMILITPTWRNYLSEPVKDLKEGRGYSNNFKNTAYYKIYNALINNEKLINCAKKNGYEITYLLHPATSSQINDYEKNEYVNIVASSAESNYEKMLTESSLMVTDYSGVQFDFAYMYKPIVYLHPDELPPSYREGVYKYKTMGFGEITKTVDDTVNLVCEYMENNCTMKEKYRERVDSFFVHHDHNNCERIYNEIMIMRKKWN